MGRLRALVNRILPAVLLAMLFGTLAPQGFMPHFGPKGLTIELCSGLGNTQASIAPDDPRYSDYLKLLAANGEGGDHDPGAADDNPVPACAFAGMAMLALPAEPALLATVPVAGAVPPALHHELLRARHHAATPPATGPPALT